MQECITVNNLSKTFKVVQKGKPGLLGSLKSLIKREYKIVEAVNNVSFTIQKGEIRGLIGPNGAGKSTTIKMLSGILYPSEGKLDVLGYTPWLQREEYVRHIGVVLGQKSQLVWDLPALDSYLLNKQIYKIPDDVYQKNLNYFLNILHIEKVVKRPVRQLSLGERMKCELVSALLHDPELIFLDEPTIGIDILAKDTIIQFIKDVNKQKGITFILTTHDISDIENLCDNVTIINNGGVVYDDTLDNLRTYFTTKRIIKAEFQREVSREELSSFKVLNYHGLTAEIEVDISESSIQSQITRLFELLPVSDIMISNIAVEDVIKEIYSNKDLSNQIAN